MAAMYYPQGQNMWQGMSHQHQGQMYAQMQGMVPGYSHGPILVEGCDEPLMPEHAIQIYALRSRATSGNSPMELAAAGRSAVVAEMYKVSSKTVKNIWTRKCWADATAPYWTEHETLMYECDKVKTTGTPEVQSPATPGSRPVSRQNSFNSNSSFSNSFNGRAKLGGSFKTKTAGSFRRRRHSSEGVARSRSQSPEPRPLSEHGGSKRNLWDLVGGEQDKLFGEPSPKRRASIHDETEQGQETTKTEALHHQPDQPVGTTVVQTNMSVDASLMANATVGITGIAVSTMEFSSDASPSACMSRAGSGDGRVHTSFRSLPPVLKDEGGEKCQDQSWNADKDQYSHETDSIADAVFKAVPSVVSSDCSVAAETRAGSAGGSHGETIGPLRSFSSEGLFDNVNRSSSVSSTTSESNFFRTISAALKRTASKMFDVSRTSSIASIGSMWNRTLSTGSETNGSPWNRVLSTEAMGGTSGGAAYSRVSRVLSTESMGVDSPAAAGFPLDLNEGGIMRGKSSMAERVDMLLEETQSTLSDQDFEPRMVDEDEQEEDCDSPKHNRQFAAQR